MLEAKLRTETEQARRDLTIKMIESYKSPGPSYSYKLVYSFPSMRYDRTAVKRVADEVGASSQETRAVHNRSFTGIDFRRKIAASVSQVSDNELRFFVRLPTASLGMRSYAAEGPDDQCLESLLSHPGITTIEGRESIGNSDTIILKVGPGIPAANRPTGLGDGGYVKLWVAPSHNYLAIRKQYHVILPTVTKLDKGDGIYTIELSDFRSVPDTARQNMSVQFPFLITYADAGGTTISKVNSVVINGTLARDEFNPAIPPDFVVSVDRGMGRKLAGGMPAKSRVVDDVVKRARATLASSAPRAPDADSWGFRLGIAGALVCTSCLVILYLLKRGVGHAR
jgi:hypothetical protein